MGNMAAIIEVWVLKLLESVQPMHIASPYDPKIIVITSIGQGSTCPRCLQSLRLIKDALLALVRLICYISSFKFGETSPIMAVRSAQNNAKLQRAKPLNQSKLCRR